MITTTFLLLILLHVKHLIVDWFLQTDQEVQQKGTYGQWGGITHSLKHAVGTLLVLVCFVSPLAAVFWALVDGVVHYHIDWTKQNVSRHYGWQPTHKQFWWAMGTDQTAHQLTYLAIAWVIVAI